MPSTISSKILFTAIHEDPFINEIINNEKGISSEIQVNIQKYFGYQNSFILVEDIIKRNQTKNNEIAYQTMSSINELKNAVQKKENPEDENINKN